MAKSLRSLSIALMLGLGVTAVSAAPAWSLGAGGPKLGSAHATISADGGFLAFNAFDSGSGRSQVFVRDLTTGATRIASRATGGAGAPANQNVQGPVTISADGTHVVFVSEATNLDPDDTDTQRDLFSRDLLNDTTVLVDRATGSPGAKANGEVEPGHLDLSADGRYVAFISRGSNLDPDDPDANDDIFRRDTLTNTTVLVGRANGASGAAANSGSGVSISNDGRYVTFLSNKTFITADDPDTVQDAFVRDVSSGSTFLVSRASGVAGVKGNGTTGDPNISGDGNHVVFGSASNNLSPDDPDTTGDVFVRDLQTATTTLASRANGPSGAKALSGASGGSISADGRYVTLNVGGNGLDPVDTNGLPDVYVRDVQAGTTTLASHYSGATGVAGNDAADAHNQKMISGDGRYVVYHSNANNLNVDDPDTAPDMYVRDRQLEFNSLESRGTPTGTYPGYPRPKAATPFYAPLVIAYQPCASPNREHAPTLTYDSCNPPAQASPNLTAGTFDANGAAVNFLGSVRLVAVGAAGGVDDSDVLIDMSMTDVRCQGSVTTCGAANAASGADYTGEVALVLPLQLTDRVNGGDNVQPATLSDRELTATTVCLPTTSTAIGSSCTIDTTADAVLPGVVPEGKRAIWELGGLRVTDGGPDGDISTPGNSVFAVQGVFVP